MAPRAARARGGPQPGDIASIETGRRERVTGIVADASPTEVRLRTLAGGVPVGGVGKLRWVAKDEPYSVQCSVIAVNGGEIGLRFTGVARLDRRRYDRHRPADWAMVRVEELGGLSGSVADYSPGGCAIRVAGRPALEVGRKVGLEILDGWGRKTSARAAIVAVRSEPGFDGVIVAFAFDELHTLERLIA